MIKAESLMYLILMLKAAFWCRYQMEKGRGQAAVLDDLEKICYHSNDELNDPDE